MAVLGQNLPPPPPFLFAISVRGAKSGFYLFIYTPIVQVASSCEKQQRTLFLTAMLFDYSSIRLGVALGSADWENRFPDLASNLLEIKEVESQQDEDVQRDWTRLFLILLWLKIF